VYFFMFEAHPKPSSEEYGVHDGAFISCWVNDPDAGIAEAAARDFVDGEGWNIDSVEDTQQLADDIQYPPDEPARKYYEHAKETGFVGVFYLWPVGGADDDDDPDAASTDG
jgi:hypothetical protein